MNKLRVYGGVRIETIGKCTPIVEYGECKRTFDDIVSGSTDKPYFGLPWALNFGLPIAADIIDVTQLNLTIGHRLLDTILHNFEDLFKCKSSGVKNYMAKLCVSKYALPTEWPSRRILYSLQSAVREKIERMTDMKKSGKIGVHADFRVTVYKYLQQGVFQMPCIEETLDRIAKSKVFSKIDLRDGYLQIPVDNESQNLFVISNPWEYYKYARLSFELSTAPLLFQQYINKVISDVPEAVAYLDDVVIGSDDENSRIVHIEIGINKILPSHERTAAITYARCPENKKELQSFSGLANYHLRFVPRLQETCKPLNEMLRKNMKRSRKLVLTCDASDVGIGASLCHVADDKQLESIAFASRVFSCPKRNYSVIDKDALAVIHATKRFQMYLFGRRFEIWTNHCLLKSIFGYNRNLSKMINGRLVRWSMWLSEYCYEIKYIKGTSNLLVDAVSKLLDRCLLIQEEFDDILKVQSEKVERLELSGMDKPFWRPKEDLSCEFGIVMWLQRIVIPKALRCHTLHLLHEGHPGKGAMKSLSRYDIWWATVVKDIEDHPLLSWVLPANVWSRIHVDIAGPIYGQLYLVSVDAKSKWPEVNTTHPSTGKSPAEIMIGRRLPNVLDNLRSSLHVHHERHNKVWYYSTITKRWLAGIIAKRNGPVSYVVRSIKGTERRIRGSHLRKRHDLIYATSLRMEKQNGNPEYSPTVDDLSNVETTEGHTLP
ncbi:hypothetical protein GJ496_004634 [Pomphorhynchus laevis]|nr:hypothetical protein GJ496_004634 [Pomphorhynchus laevis]